MKRLTDEDLFAIPREAGSPLDAAITEALLRGLDAENLEISVESQRRLIRALLQCLHEREQ